MYLILLVLGLLIGAVFLVFLLLGDKRESRLESQEKAFQEQVTVASEPVEGSWPPPLEASARPQPSAPLQPTKRASGNGRQILRTFFRYRNAAAGVLFISAVVYASYPEINFAWVLLGTISAAALFGAVHAEYKKRRRT